MALRLRSMLVCTPLVCTFACRAADVILPGVTLLAPIDGATVCGAPLRVEVEVEGLDLVAPGPAEDAAPGTGHVDLTLNGQDALMFWEPTAEIEAVESGEYQVKVELSNADHTPVEPYAADLVYVEVSEAACDAQQ
jgi:hypothetical protein